MKRAMILAALMVGIGGILAPVSAADGAKESPPRLTVNLSDGSRVIGEPVLTGVSIQSESLGKLEVPLNKIRVISFSPKHDSVTVALVNGDKLQGRIGNTELALRTIFGPVKIPVAQVKDLAVTSAAIDAVLSEGLVAYYPFNGDARDHSENENHGKGVGIAFEEAGAAKALRVDGNSSSYVVIPRADSLEPAEAITISMWIKGVPGQAAGHGWGTLLRKADNCQAGYYIRGGGVSQFALDGQNPCGNGRHGGAGFLPFSEKQWQHITATYSREEGVVKTYQDGSLVNQAAFEERLVHSGDLYVGGDKVAGDGGGFRGLICDVRIYKRALSVGEIRDLFAKGSPCQ